MAMGQSVGPYRIEGVLGTGGMGRVYLAHDTTLKRAVAIKVVDPMRQNADALLREAQLAAALDHPSICTVHEVGHIGAEPFIVMEHIKGTRLSEVINGLGVVPLETALHYAIQMVDAVAHAHERGIIHGDLKSSNIMIGADGRVKVLDFGLAVRNDVLSLPLSDDADSTCPPPSSECAGTVPYMAPERLRGHAPDVRSDIWALGVVLHEMLVGACPFRGGTAYELAADILANQRAQLTPRLPAPVSRVIERCLSPHRQDRYPTARALGGALDDLDCCMTSGKTQARAI
jgi:serine/threonine protein kinase